jgi:murein DD-endopeptidase MepM/ murein hydrolase activator NlpD
LPPDVPDTSQASGLGALRATSTAVEVAGSGAASGLAALRATITAVPTSITTGEVDAVALDAIVRGCEPARDWSAAASPTGAATQGVDGGSSGGGSNDATCGPGQDKPEAEDELMARRRRALELGAARLATSLDLAQYADRLARLNGWLVSPFGEVPLTSRMIRFGYLSEYSEELAFEIRGEDGVALLGTRHFGLDLQVPWLPEGGRGLPVVAPFDGRIVRTADPAGGQFGIWLENRQLNLRARLMHMDGLVVGIESGVQVQAGQQLGVLGAQGTEGFPHLHLAFERLSDGARINPALFYRLRDWSDPATHTDRWFDDPAAAPVVALRQPRPATLIREGDGRAASVIRTLLVVSNELVRPHRLTDLLSPIELPYP